MIHPKIFHREHGLSLIELMIAITISTALLAGVIQIFASSKSTYRTQEAFARLSENLRFALDVISQDISTADFWGCNPTAIADDIPGTPAFEARGGENQLKDSAGANFIDFAQNGPTGTGGGLFGTEGDVITLGEPDTLTVRGLTGTPARVLRVEAANSPVILAQANTTFQVGQIVGLADCESTDFFQITGIDGTMIQHEADMGEPPQNKQTLLSKNTYGINSALYRAQQITYSLANGANNRLALFRNINNNNVELVSNVDNFQVKYGEDTNGDLIVDRYVDANAAGFSFANVVSLRITLTLSSGEDNVSPVARNAGEGVTDRRLQKSITTTIPLRNRLS